jgi:hypothetical protein
MPHFALFFLEEAEIFRENTEVHDVSPVIKLFFLVLLGVLGLHTLQHFPLD